jgi:hypothetical protein
MLVADILLSETGSDVDGPVEGLLHLGCEFVWFHGEVGLSGSQPLSPVNFFAEA